ncbi:hypothetical protein M902_1373 [Bacteriovorax sp. BAL6_X]|uniref:hypothetical protein n=1 Tax=Bacteriovorax sp. BAL6_X TaxID=1201290 RepID=UPI000385F59D|nr:hypothetical protein [Bacteriovorax sp. BAL6_X]EPZ50572.1 hypothetical protein M902_1373 [Bacteriovorax sp. BAL6_X]
MRLHFFYSLLSIVLMIFTFNAKALDTKVELSLEGDEKAWSVGEIRDFKLTIYPITDVIDEDINNNLMSRDFADIVKISKINKQYFLKTNPQYYIIEASGVLVATPKNSFPKIWDYRGMALGVSFSGINFQDTQVTQQDFIVFDKKIEEEKSFVEYVIYIIVLLIVCLASFYGFHVYNIKQSAKRVLAEKIDLFKNADTREKHEDIYSKKINYEEIFENAEFFKDYLNKINELQYKRSWTHDDDITISDLHNRAKENIIVK